jgi:hypothetical protein
VPKDLGKEKAAAVEDKEGAEILDESEEEEEEEEDEEKEEEMGPATPGPPIVAPSIPTTVDPLRLLVLLLLLPFSSTTLIAFTIHGCVKSSAALLLMAGCFLRHAAKKSLKAGDEASGNGGESSLTILNNAETGGRWKKGGDPVRSSIVVIPRDHTSAAAVTAPANSITSGAIQ